MNKAKTCAGTILVDRHPGPPSYEILSVHFPDGGIAVTIGDILARLGITVKDRDRVKITVSRLPAASGRTRK
jgi:hypothetical protein